MTNLQFVRPKTIANQLSISTAQAHKLLNDGVLPLVRQSEKIIGTFQHHVDDYLSKLASTQLFPNTHDSFEIVEGVITAIDYDTSTITVQAFDGALYEHAVSENYIYPTLQNRNLKTLKTLKIGSPIQLQFEAGDAPIFDEVLIKGGNHA